MSLNSRSELEISYGELGEDVQNTPPDIHEEAEAATLNLLPKKSNEKYTKEFKSYMEWCKQNGVKNHTENVLLAYFSMNSKVLKSPTLWSKYSKLRTMLLLKENVDIKFPKVLAFLKRQSDGYRPKQSKTFSRGELNKFLIEAPDDNFLLMKVLAVLGIAGACRCDELVNMLVDDIEDKDSILIVKIPDSKTKKKRVFTVTGEKSDGPNFIEIYRKYASLRPQTTEYRRFFLSYRAGRCINQVVGKNSMSKIPQKIANYLKLPNPTAYTGHCFRRTSASLLVDAGGDILTLKRHGGWKSTAVAEGYIEESIAKKQKIANQIIMGDTQNLDKVSKNLIITENISENVRTHSCSSSSSGAFNFSNAQNCTITINIDKSEKKCKLENM